MKMYFKGTSGMSEVFDINGVKISEGDLLSMDCGDHEKYNMIPREGWEVRPIFRVKEHAKGGYFADGINQHLYLHDFRFKFTHKIINPQKQATP